MGDLAAGGMVVNDQRDRGDGEQEQEKALHLKWVGQVNDAGRPGAKREGCHTS
jgi:hypothetical protein